MLRLYVADISNLPDPLSNPEFLYRLPEERQQRIHNMKQEKSRKQSMGAGLLLQKVLALYHMEDAKVFVGEQGKPMIEGLEFSLSHSADLVICAVSDKPVGCDVEKVRKTQTNVAERYFSRAERKYLGRFVEGEYDKEFLRLWTMKESYAKMTGEGMALTLGNFEILLKGEVLPSWDTESVYKDSVRIIRNGKTKNCYVSTMEWHGYIISICTESSAPAEVIWEIL